MSNPKKPAKTRLTEAAKRIEASKPFPAKKKTAKTKNEEEE